MPFFKKKPVVIEAVRVMNMLGLARDGKFGDMPEWLQDACRDDTVQILLDNIRIETSEGVMRADRDDWIIRGQEGELYPCKPSVFKATYDSVDAALAEHLIGTP